MENDMNIYMKLQEARCRLQSMNLKKSGKNSFAKFSYYELSDFVPMINLIFKDLKMFSTFSMENKELATLAIINVEKPEDKVVFSTPVEKAEVKGCSPVQALGAVHTYLKRYLYMNALEIVESDMLDAQVGNNEKNKNSEMIERINQIGTLEELNDMLSYFRKMEINDTTWKKCLFDKSLAIGAVYNQECECFERKVDPQILVA